MFKVQCDVILDESNSNRAKHVIPKRPVGALLCLWYRSQLVLYATIYLHHGALLLPFRRQPEYLNLAWMTDFPFLYVFIRCEMLYTVMGSLSPHPASAYKTWSYEGRHRNWCKQNYVLVKFWIQNTIFKFCF